MRSLVTLLLTLTTVAASAAPSDAAFKSGQQALRQGNGEKAAEFFEQAVKAQPNNADYHFWLGNAYGAMAREASIFKQLSLAKKTKAAFERAVQIDPNHIDARFGLLSYYAIAPGIAGGDMKKAEEQAAEIKKRDALDGHRAWALVYTRQKRPELARKEFLDAIAEQPNSAKPRYYYAAVLASEKNYQGAFDQLDAALKIDPAFMPLHYQVGRLAGLSGLNLARGRDGLYKYLTHKPAEDEPSHARAHYWIGVIYEKEGRKAEAKQSFQTALRLAPGTKEFTEALKRVSS